MKKRILSIVLVLVLLFSVSSVLATENVPDVPANVLSEEDVLLTTSDKPEDIANPTLVNSLENDYGVTYVTGNKVITDDGVSLENTSINGNLVIFAKDVNVKDVDVNGDVAIFAEFVNVANLTVTNGVTVIAAQRIDVDMLLTTGNVYTAAETVKTTAIAKGLYVAASKVEVGAESVIENVYNLQEVMPEPEMEEVVIETTTNIIKAKVIAVLAVIVKSVFVCGFIFLFTSDFINKTKTDNIVKYLGLSALKGAGWAILIPIMVIALCCTGIAVGVGFATLALYVIIFWASVPFVSIAIMNTVAKEDDTKGKKFGLTLGIAFAIAVLGRIPAIGGFITILVGFAGMGIVIGSLKCKCGCKKSCKKDAEVVEVVEKVEEVKEDDKSEEDK